MATGRPAGTVVALSSSHADLEPLLRALALRFRILALEAPRRSHPRRFGVPAASGDWFLGEDACPDPLGFCVCLEQLERFLLGKLAGARALLLGGGQGATLALALACCWPERLLGVLAIGGAFPQLPPGALAERPLEDLPVWLVGAGTAPAEGTIEALRSRRASVEVVSYQAAFRSFARLRLAARR
jgi:pimeloyl-ACP methyl ester carboxylesterase